MRPSLVNAFFFCSTFLWFFSLSLSLPLLWVVLLLSLTFSLPAALFQHFLTYDVQQTGKGYCELVQVVLPFSCSEVLRGKWRFGRTSKKEKKRKERKKKGRDLDKVAFLPFRYSHSLTHASHSLATSLFSLLSFRFITHIHTPHIYILPTSHSPYRRINTHTPLLLIALWQITAHSLSTFAPSL